MLKSAHESVSQYLETLAARGRRAGTLKAVEKDLRLYILWWETHYNQSFEPMLLTEQSVRIWLNERYDSEKVRATTLNRALWSLRSYCKWAITSALMDHNPVAAVKELPTVHLSPKILPTEAINALLKAVQREKRRTLRVRDEALISLLIYNGLHPQEVCDIQLRDVDIAAATLIIRHHKIGKARRLLLHVDVQRLLSLYVKQVRCPQGFPAVGSIAEQEPLFARIDVTEPGWSTTPGISTQVVQRVVRHAGQIAAQIFRATAADEEQTTRAEVLLELACFVEHVTPSMLRHSLAQRLLNEGEPLPHIQQLLGHSQLAITEMYLNRLPDEIATR